MGFELADRFSQSGSQLRKTGLSIREVVAARDCGDNLHFLTPHGLHAYGGALCALKQAYANIGLVFAANAGIELVNVAQGP
jgi:hypothetical protein